MGGSERERRSARMRPEGPAPTMMTFLMGWALVLPLVAIFEDCLLVYLKTGGYRVGV